MRTLNVDIYLFEDVTYHERIFYALYNYFDGFVNKIDKSLWDALRYNHELLKPGTVYFTLLEEIYDRNAVLIEEKFRGNEYVYANGKITLWRNKL